MASNSIRISSDLFVSAHEEAQLMSRSAAQQLEHWARLGRAMERSGLPLDKVKSALLHEQQLKTAGKPRSSARSRKP